MTALTLFLWLLYLVGSYGVMFAALLFRDKSGLQTFARAMISDDKNEIAVFLGFIFIISPITCPIFLVCQGLQFLGLLCFLIGNFTIASNFTFIKSATQEELETLRAELKVLKEGKK